ncbi:MAG: sigma-54-dependent Fis family transcriptional regulator [Planctomycetes bacterium]|nr:sigma-54-dependent Fis family transcriptional regulator [Planctomycetota bacterium]
MLRLGRNSESGFLRLLARLGEEPASRGLLTEIADGLLRALDAERLFLLRFRKGGGFQVLAARNLDGETLSRPHERISHHAVRKMLRARGVWVVEDARQDRRYRSEDVIAGAKPPLSIIILPLRTEGEILGGIYVDHRFQKLGAAAVRRSDVRAWTALCALAVSIREQAKRRRWLERKLAIRQRLAVLAGGSEPSAERPARPSLSLRRPLPPAGRVEELHGFVSANPDMLDLFDTIRGLRESAIGVLIRGETGTGKSLLARAVHLSSARSDHPLVNAGCASIPETLIESELFGHVRGAFTGADRDREGLIVQAHGGTLLLDEVGDLGVEMQSKLLRVIEDGKVRPLGAKDEIEVDIRIVATTSRDLDILVRRNLLRRDLFYRLRALELEISPLRERWEDIPVLAEHFLRLHGEGGAAVPITPEAMQLMLDYPWPGNARELESEIRRLLALGHREIAPGALASFIRRKPPAAMGGGRREAGDLVLDDAVSAAERDVIVAALERCRGNKSRAAEILGIARKTLYRRLRKYGISQAEPRSAQRWLA